MLKRRAGPLAGASVLLLFFGLLAYFAPPSVLLSRHPVLTMDYALHIYQVERAVHAFFGWKKLWSYDPLMLAGQPAGVVEDLTSKGTELFAIALTKAGVPLGLAYNLFIVVVHLGMPVCCWWSARLFGLTRAESLIALLLCVLLWFFDSFLHWCWAVGMITWSAACYLSVLYVALLYRTLTERRRWQFVALCFLGALLTLIHPFAAFTVLVPAVLLYARAFRSLEPIEHGLVWIAALAAASTVLVWVGPLLRFHQYVGDVDTFLRPRASYVIFDFFDLVKDWQNTGTPVRTMVRTLCFAAGAAALWRLHRKKDPRVLPLASLIVSTVAFAYLAGYFWHGRQTQPYRQIGVAMLAAALPAAIVLREALAPSALRELSRPARTLLGLALVLIVPRFVRTLTQYVPEVLPKPVEHRWDIVNSSLGELTFEPKPFSLRPEGPTPGYEAVRTWLMQHDPGSGRVAVFHWPLCEYLAASTPLPVLGGILERNVPHVDAHPLRQPPPTPDFDSIKEYIERYAVGWVVVTGGLDARDAREDLFLPPEKVAEFRIYQARVPPNYFLRGQGLVVFQSLNSIVVNRAAGPEVVLKFHWMETLRCRPNCRLERFPVPHDRVGFIRVPSPPAAFEIYSEYGS